MRSSCSPIRIGSSRRATWCSRRARAGSPPNALEFNTRTKTGTFYNASGSATLAQAAAQPGAEDRSMFGTQEPDVYFYGETLQKLGEQKYKITRGGFTTCLQPTPRWELTSQSVTLNLEHYAHPHQLAVQGEGRARVLHADLLLPRPEGRPRDRVPDSHLRVLDDQGTVPEQRVLLGDQPQPGPHAAARLVLEDGPGLRHRIPVRPRPGLRWLPALLQPAGARGAGRRHDNP